MCDGDIASLLNIQIIDGKLSGIPAEIGNLSNLTTLILPHNQLSGMIPSEISNLDKLTDLRLQQNQLTGTIPTEFGNLTSLIVLELRENQLSGPIPDELGYLPNLAAIYINNNQFSGPLPQSLTNLNLSWFWFDNTDLCEPNDPAFQEWLDGIENLRRTNVLCE